MNEERLVQEITQFYLNSPDFNGIPIQELAKRSGLDRASVVEDLGSLIKKEMVAVVYPSTQPNPGARNFAEPIEAQLERLATPELDDACAYPLSKHLEKIVDRSQYEGRPYSLALALGTPQLEHRAFDLIVLEHYRNDPRYEYETDDISGRIRFRRECYDPNLMPEKDQILLKSFGFCYDSGLNRAVGVFVYRLAELSPEHQQLWKTKELTGDYQLHPDFCRRRILAVPGEGVSIFEAFVEEMRIINEMARAMGRPPLFRKEFTEQNRPREFSFLVRPTLKEFNYFIELLDKMMSQNINKGFFQKEVPEECEETRHDGKVVVRQKGTIQILDGWLHSYPRPQNWEPVNRMVKTFKEVRKRRQKPAHSVGEDEFDQAFFHQQRALMTEAYEAIRMLRLILANHPAAKNIEVHPLLQNGKIWTY